MTTVQRATQTTIGIMALVIILVAAAYGIGLVAIPSVVWCFTNVVSPWYELLPIEIQIMTWLILSMIPVSALVWVLAWIHHRIKLAEKESNQASVLDRGGQ